MRLMCLDSGPDREASVEVDVPGPDKEASVEVDVPGAACVHCFDVESLAIFVYVCPEHVPLFMILIRPSCSTCQLSTDTGCLFLLTAADRPAVKL